MTKQDHSGTAQERLWRGEFGDEYTKRQRDQNIPMIEANKELFREVLGDRYFREAHEFGCGEGYNMIALKEYAVKPLSPVVVGSDVNEGAVEVCRKKGLTAYVDSILTPYRGVPYDLVLTKGLLVHIHPDDLLRAYKNIYLAAKRYVLMCEYYAPTSEHVVYRDQLHALWRGDFAGDFMKEFPAFDLIDYGFVYHGDPVAPQDDLTWFLMERTP